jgi:hypothetical protein
MDEFFKGHKALYTPGSKIFSERNVSKVFEVEEEKSKKSNVLKLEAIKVNLNSHSTQIE